MQVKSVVARFFLVDTYVVLFLCAVLLMFYWQVVLGIGDWGVPSLSGWQELEQGRGL